MAECVDDKGSKDGKEKDVTSKKSNDDRWRYTHAPYPREVMIIASFGTTSALKNQVVPKVIPTDNDKSRQWMRKELDLIQDLYRQDPQHSLEYVFPDFPEMERSKQYYLEKITKLLTDCKKPGALIWYTGHGEEKTGNWCFKDGVITFQDIFGLYMDHFKGKVLTIISDCSYSGNWVNDCAKTLDDIAIPPCGHYAKEEGILLKVYCSCKEYQKATALVWVEEGAYFNEEYERTMLWISGKVFSNGQRPRGYDFTQINCRKQIHVPCDMPHSHTWQDKAIDADRMQKVRGKDCGRRAWHLVLVDSDKFEEFKERTSTGTERVNVAHYGKVFKSGWGEDPPDEAMKVWDRFNTLDPEDETASDIAVDAPKDNEPDKSSQDQPDKKPFKKLESNDINITLTSSKSYEYNIKEYKYNKERDITY